MLRNQHTDVTGYSRIFGNSSELVVEVCKLQNALNINHCNICTVADSVIVSNQRMNLSKVSHNSAFIDHVGLSSRMKERLLACRIIFHFLLHADLFKEFLANTLHVKEITVSVHSKCEHGSLIRQFCKRQSLWQINISKLVQANVFVSSVVVGCKGRKHSVQGAGTHDAVVLTKRIADGDHLAEHIILRDS